jgi:hypothetical protein
MKNVIELRDRLTNAFTDLEKDKISAKKASELKGIAATMVASAKTQVDYQKLIGSTNKIDFLEG